MDLLQGLKAVLADALVSEGADKARDVSVLRWAARLDQDVLDVMLMSPHPEPLTGELQSVIDFDRLGGAKALPPCPAVLSRTPHPSRSLRWCPCTRL